MPELIVAKEMWQNLRHFLPATIVDRGFWREREREGGRERERERESL